jgi:hypothetical protein
MRHANRLSYPLVAGVGVALLTAAGLVSAELAFEEREDYEQSGVVFEGVGQWNEGLEGLHPGEVQDFRPAVAELLDRLEISAEPGMPPELVDPRPGILMFWGGGDTAVDQNVIGAWRLTLPEDPDLTGQCITLTAFPRQGMTSISFSLRDGAGTMKGWRWLVGAGGLPHDTPTTLTVAAGGGFGEAGSTFFWDGGVNLTNIVAFEFDESGHAAGNLPLPAGSALPLGFVGQWNYWHDIVVTPCPPKADHLACYKVKPKAKVKLKDIMITNQFHPNGLVIEIDKLEYLCVPTIKEHLEPVEQ